MEQYTKIYNWYKENNTDLSHEELDQLTRDTIKEL
jgi:hypothetical protein